MGKIIVIGGGAAGMMAAAAAAEQGVKVIVYEKNEKLGKKLFITGKGAILPIIVIWKLCLAMW